jgi:hypothetical protein
LELMRARQGRPHRAKRAGVPPAPPHHTAKSRRKAERASWCDRGMLPRLLRRKSVTRQPEPIRRHAARLTRAPASAAVYAAPSGRDPTLGTRANRCLGRKADLRRQSPSAGERPGCS